MKNFRYWRKMTWAILLSGAFLFVWVVTGGFSLSLIALSLGVLGVLWALWFLTQPPWRRGRGLHLRRPQYVHVPFKVPSSTNPQDIR
jgi:hypothetical protein